MTIFYVTLAIVSSLALIARLKMIKVGGKASIFYTSLICIILILISGLRTNIGDTGMYVHTYEIIGPNYDGNGVYEVGFVLFLKFLKSISYNPQFMIMTISIIVNICIICTLWNYSEDSFFELSIFLYISSGYFLVTMNGIRQCLAASIIFAFTPLIIKGKDKWYIVIIFIACTIHSSAFIMIPIYFIARLKPWSKNTLLLVACTIIAMFLYQPLMELASQILGSKVETYKESTEKGTSIIRIAIFFIPVILSYLKRDELNKKWMESRIFVNITMLSALVMLFSKMHWVFARFTLYLQPYTFILMAYMVKNVFKGSERRLLYYGLVVCYSVFFFIECPSNLNNIPYKTDFKLKEFFYK